MKRIFRNGGGDVHVAVRKTGGKNLNANGREWPRMAANDREWPRMAANGREWPRMAANGPESPAAQPFTASLSISVSVAATLSFNAFCA
jgi:hypothetical protein